MPGVQSGCLDSCETLRTVWLWDENYVDPELVESLCGALPDARIYQGFDQAECAFFVTLLLLTGGDDESHTLHGQPLPNTRVRPNRCAASMHLYGRAHIMILPFKMCQLPTLKRCTAFEASPLIVSKQPPI